MKRGRSKDDSVGLAVVRHGLGVVDGAPDHAEGFGEVAVTVVLLEAVGAETGSTCCQYNKNLCY